MALSGTISDFGLGDIFQLIGIQRKTGELRLKSEDDVVTVQFLEGQVVGADTKSASVEDLLGAVLVRTGRISEEQLKKALKVQTKTLQRLGHILVKQRFITEEDLVEALRVQSLQIVYRLFRWRKGSYEFISSDNLDYDQKHFIPISAETILMEGARMIDEWPIIERRIRSEKMVLQRTETYADVDLGEDSPLPIDEGMEFDFVFDKQAEDEKPEPEGESSPADQLSPEEKQLLRFVDGKRSVIEINDHTNLGEFDTCRILAELMNKGWVEEVQRIPTSRSSSSRREIPAGLFYLVAGVVMLALIALSARTLPTNRWTPWHQGLADEATQSLQRLTCQQRMERLEAAVQTYYLDHGGFPTQLTVLASGPYLAESDLVDPWGQPYIYELSNGGYQIRTESDASFDLLHRFTAVERMMHLPEETAQN